MSRYLTRRANQRHCFIIAQSVKRPWPRNGALFSAILGENSYSQLKLHWLAAASDRLRVAEPPRFRRGAKLIGRAQNILGLPRRSISKNVSNLLKQRTGSCKSARLTILEPACRSESIYSPHRRNESHRKLTFENPDARGNPEHDAGPRQPAESAVNRQVARLLQRNAGPTPRRRGSGEKRLSWS